MARIRVLLAGLHASHQWNSFAMPLQKPTGSSTDCLYSASYSALDLTCALALSACEEQAQVPGVRQSRRALGRGTC